MQSPGEQRVDDPAADADERSSGSMTGRPPADPSFIGEQPAAPGGRTDDRPGAVGGGTPKLRKGDLVDLCIHTLAFGGKGVARLDDFVIFVTGAVPGDTVRALVTKNKKRYAEARVVELLQPSSDRVAARCSAFGRCGGCVWQDLDYGAQLGYKAHQVRESLEHLGGLTGFELRPALSPANPWRYRNRADFSVGMSETGAVVGFRPRGRWDTVLPLTECHLMSRGMEALRTTVENWLRTHDLPGWDPRTNTGYVRHLLVRTAQSGREMLASLVTAPGELPDETGLVETLRTVHPELVGIAHAVNPGRAELSSGLEARMLWGRLFLYERLAGVTLKISLNAFFQTNTLMAHELYELVAREVFVPPVPYDGVTGMSRTAAPVDSGPVVWDLYSGVGSIGLALAMRGARILGIEAVPAAVVDARENARLNGLARVEFIEGDVRRVLREVAQGTRSLPQGLDRPDVVVVDPPRAGLHQRVVARIGELAAPRIVYVSCNPSTMAPNIAQLCEHGYRLLRVTPVDMFPQTPHVEAVAVLSRSA
ncbi:MAG: 23S rRNA (uracil(1939)-C(5))-methyltransferase RlmD [Thermoleophilia bacterium]|jgi:23S rRNA (uracil1939-C5)-methyltransferase